MNDTENFILNILRPMLTKGKYGDLTIKVKDGKVAHVHEGKVHKPSKRMG